MLPKIGSLVRKWGNFCFSETKSASRQILRVSRLRGLINFENIAYLPIRLHVRAADISYPDVKQEIHAGNVHCVCTKRDSKVLGREK